MAYDMLLAQRVRKYLQDIPKIDTEEKKMFGGLAFMVNGKMCVNVSGNELMCRFDPSNVTMLEKRLGYHPMNMRGHNYVSYCYVSSAGFDNTIDFSFWLEQCIDFNGRAKSSKK